MQERAMLEDAGLLNAHIQSKRGIGDENPCVLSYGFAQEMI
jgi:hypothetical protein